MPVVFRHSGLRYYFFSNEGNVIPRVGWRAVWTLHRHQIWPLGNCVPSACPYSSFVDYMLFSDYDISPIADSVHVVP